MACIIPNNDQFLNALRNKNLIYETNIKDTYEDIGARLEHTQNTVSLDEKNHLYTVKDYTFKTSATQEVEKKFHPEGYKFKPDPIFSEFGTAGHKFLEEYLRGNDPSEVNGWKISQDARERLMNVADSIMNEANRIQDRIDPNKRPGIFVEQRVVNPFEERSSTADVIILFSDKTALIYDFKFKAHTEKYFEHGKLVDASKLTRKNAEHEMQLAIIANDLKKSYGVVEVIGGRVIPIASYIPVYWNFSKNDWAIDMEETTKSIDLIETPFDEDTIIRQALLLPEKVRTKGIDDFIEKQYVKIRKLEATKKEEDRLLAEKLRDEVYNIVIYNDFELLLKNLEKMYYDFQKRIDQPKIINGEENKEYYSDEDLQEMYLKLKSAEIIASDISGYLEKMKRIGAVEEKEAEKIKKTVGELSMRVQEITLVVDGVIQKRYIADKIGQNVLDENGKVKLQRGDGIINNWLFSLSDQNNYFARALAQLKLENEKEVSDELEKYIEKWSKINNNLNKWISQNGRKLFIDLVFDKKTKNLIKQLDQKFFDERKKALDSDNVEWLKEHYEPTRTKKEFEDRREAYKQKLILIEESNDEVNKKLTQFDKKYDLWSEDGEAWRNPYAVKIKESVFKNPKYVTPEYKKIMGTPLEEFYDFYKSSMFNFIGMIDKRDTIRSNFVPWIRQDVVESIMNNGMFNIEKLKDTMMTMFSARNDSSYLSQGFTGRLEQEVPVYFINPKRNDKGEIIPGEEKSLDFMNSLLAFGKMAMVHKAAKKNAGAANMLVEAFSNSRMYETDIFGNLQRVGAAFGEREVSELEKESMRAFRDYYWYGVEMRTKDWAIKLGNSEVSAIETVRTIKRYWTLNTLSLGVKQAVGGYIGAKANTWTEGAKGIYFTGSQYAAATKKAYQQPKDFLALGLWMDIYTNDVLERKLKAKGIDAMDANKAHLSFLSQSFQDPRYGDYFRRYVNERAAMGIWSYESENRDNTLVNTVAMNFGIDKDGNFSRFRKDWFEKDGVTLKQEYKTMGYKSIAEIFKYDEKKGPRFEVNGKQMSKEESDKIWTKFREALKRIRSGISGEVGAEEKSVANMSLWGQLLLQYRSWMPGILREKFGGIQYDHRTMSIHQGRYRVLAKHLFQDDTKKDDQIKSIAMAATVRFAEIIVEAAYLLPLFRKMVGKKEMYGIDYERIKTEYKLWIENNPDYQDVATLEDYIEMRVGQLNAMVVELRMVLGFLASLYLMLMWLGADDDEDDERVLRSLYAVTRKAYSELTFTLFPSEYIKLTQNPIPLVSVLSTVTAATANGFDEFRDKVTKENSPYDKTEWGHYSKKLLPALSNFGRLIEWSEEDKKYLQEKPFEVRF